MNAYIPLETALEILAMAYTVSVMALLTASVAGMAVIEALEASTIQ